MEKGTLVVPIGVNHLGITIRELTDNIWEVDCTPFGISKVHVQQLFSLVQLPPIDCDILTPEQALRKYFPEVVTALVVTIRADLEDLEIGFRHRSKASPSS